MMPVAYILTGIMEQLALDISRIIKTPETVCFVFPCPVKPFDTRILEDFAVSSLLTLSFSISYQYRKKIVYPNFYTDLKQKETLTN